MLSLSPTILRRLEAYKSSIFHNIGSSEAVIPVEGEERAMLKVTLQWRKPLSFDEVNQMAQTPEVRGRPGRP